ncbi:MAG: DUF881 domain-containing protein [Propionibacteriales bacterium]|nr:DUF881 domain-containing protein [Propionibacteriales bacterium]
MPDQQPPERPSTPRTGSGPEELGGGRRTGRRRELRVGDELRDSRRPRRASTGRQVSTSRRLRRAAVRAGQESPSTPETPSTPPAPPTVTEPSSDEEQPADGGQRAARGATSSAARASAEDHAVPARKRILTLLVRPARGQVAAALALCLVGFGVVTQIRSQQSDDDYSTARREDLVQLLDGLNQETRRLESEVTDLQQTRENLASGADADKVARAEATRRADVLGILAGTKPAEGPGIKMVITDPNNKVSPGIVLDAIEEMRDAGAEVIEINDSIRVVSSSWIANGQDGMLVDDQLVKTPITIEAIGDAHSLAEAAKFRGGLISQITAPNVGGRVDLTTPELITVDSLHTPKPNQYAQPAPEKPG